MRYTCERGSRAPDSRWLPGRGGTEVGLGAAAVVAGRVRSIERDERCAYVRAIASKYFFTTSNVIVIPLHVPRCKIAKRCTHPTPDVNDGTPATSVAAPTVQL
jgi:hypothetical protein